MRTVLQRAASASVTVDGEVVGAIGPGLVALVGVADGDDAAVAERAADKTAALRILCLRHGIFGGQAIKMLKEAMLGLHLFRTGRLSLKKEKIKGMKELRNMIDSSAPRKEAVPL